MSVSASRAARGRRPRRALRVDRPGQGGEATGVNPRPSKSRPLIGWREWVLLPGLSPVPVKAKIDTGARTSVLHAFRLVLRTGSDGIWADFEVHPVQHSQADSTTVSSPVAGFRQVRSSSGHLERRPVIRTPVRIGPHRFEIDVTLTSRDEMGFRMLLGRSAVRRRFWVDPGRSFLYSAAGDRPGPTTTEDRL